MLRFEIKIYIAGGSRWSNRHFLRKLRPLSAVSVSVHGRGLGSDLLLAAGSRVLAVAAQVGGVALAIDAKDARAASWYERFGAMRLLDDRLRLILPLDTIAHAVAAAQKKG
jgi:hypothetical protein